MPRAHPVNLYNLNNINYEAQWFNLVTNKTQKGKVATKSGALEIIPPAADKNDYVLVLHEKS